MSLREIETGCKLYIETDELERARGKMMQKGNRVTWREPEKTAYEKVARLGRRRDCIVKSSRCAP